MYRVERGVENGMNGEEEKGEESREEEGVSSAFLEGNDCRCANPGYPKKSREDAGFGGNVEVEVVGVDGVAVLGARKYLEREIPQSRTPWLLENGLAGGAPHGEPSRIGAVCIGKRRERAIEDGIGGEEQKAESSKQKGRNKNSEERRAKSEDGLAREERFSLKEQEEDKDDASDEEGGVGASGEGEEDGEEDEAGKESVEEGSLANSQHSRPRQAELPEECGDMRIGKCSHGAKHRRAAEIDEPTGMRDDGFGERASEEKRRNMHAPNIKCRVESDEERERELKKGEESGEAAGECEASCEIFEPPFLLEKHPCTEGIEREEVEEECRFARRPTGFLRPEDGEEYCAEECPPDPEDGRRREAEGFSPCQRRKPKEDCRCDNYSNDGYIGIRSRPESELEGEEGEKGDKERGKRRHTSTIAPKGLFSRRDRHFLPRRLDKISKRC